MKRALKGFTLMELLIVIGVLGILAAGLLAAIDPFEQLNKARDANTRNTVIELMNAGQRYYATAIKMPWNNTAIAACAASDWSNIKSDTSGNSFSAGKPMVTVAKVGTAVYYNQNINNCLNQALITDTGELKDTFFDGLQNVIYVGSGALNKIVVCFSPESKAEKAKDTTKYCLDSNSRMTDNTTTCSTATTKFQCFQ